MSNAQVAEIGDMYGKPVTRRDIGKKCGFTNCHTAVEINQHQIRGGDEGTL